MGSFSMTCSASGLGISAGTKVRAFLLTESPYSDRGADGWSVRTPPLRAEYNDYGSIENVHPDDLPIADLWLRGLREDLVEVGTGDNQCHDVPARKDMTFAQFLDALQEGRVRVRQDVEHFWRRPMDFSHLRSAEDQERDRLTALKAELNDKVTGSGLFCGKYVLDEPASGSSGSSMSARGTSRTFPPSSRPPRWPSLKKPNAQWSPPASSASSAHRRTARKAQLS